MKVLHNILRRLLAIVHRVAGRPNPHHSPPPSLTLSHEPILFYLPPLPTPNLLSLPSSFFLGLASLLSRLLTCRYPFRSDHILSSFSACRQASVGFTQHNPHGTSPSAPSTICIVKADTSKGPHALRYSTYYLLIADVVLGPDSPSRAPYQPTTSCSSVLTHFQSYRTVLQHTQRKPTHYPHDSSPPSSTIGRLEQLGLWRYRLF